MTDGCGYMNRACKPSNLHGITMVPQAFSVAQRIQRIMGLDDLPSAVQMRIGGAKGMVSI